MTTAELDIPRPSVAARPPDDAPARTIALLALCGLFTGLTTALVSAFVPPLVRDVLGDRRTLIGVVMALDNVLLLALVPVAGPASDHGVTQGRGRLPLIVAGMGLAAIGTGVLGGATQLGLSALVTTLLVLHAGVNLQRAPAKALLVDLVPSHQRSLATGAVTFLVCAGGLVFLLLGRARGMQAAFLAATGTIGAIALLLRAGLRERTPASSRAGAEAHGAGVSVQTLARAVGSVLRGHTPGMRPVFLATVLLQLAFQTFATWFALHAIERFDVTVSEATIGFIAWGVGGALGALPAGLLGIRLGRRSAMLGGVGLMLGCLVALDRVTTITHAVPLLALTSAAWTFPLVNAFPLFVESVPRERRGVLASLFLLGAALGGAIGDPLNGRLFDLLGGYRALFVVMAGYTTLAFAAVCRIPAGAGEAAAIAGQLESPDETPHASAGMRLSPSSDHSDQRSALA